MTETNRRLKNFILAALFAALIAILAQVTIPLPLVPITGQTLAVGLTATVLGSRYGTLAILIYILMGVIGLPVFSEAKGGLPVLIGPTGGFITGFVVTAYVTGLILEKSRFTFWPALLANLIGMVVTLLFGWIQLKYVMSWGWGQALAVGVYPFLAVGVIKAALAAYLGVLVRKRLVSARLISSPHISQ
ncbi:biotin transporter BioY [Brevibacillus fulvus]|uniref:Biotin transporter n=1 Tax=Brevibacillus fulvus TaxID=1125967 RepID=A0A938XSQ9_9BACL|nr:biotin transporter BioY [Brevibacillus fulvus]MBM7589718.1 biotin transport system substrate-specific component [Brevibacillus fulvus]